MRGRKTLARYAAPAAFLLAATIAILIVRAGLSNENDGACRAPRGDDVDGGGAGGDDDRGRDDDERLADAEFYEIEAGDTLADVADQFDTTVEALLVLNPDVDPVALRIGQRIRVK